jgi:hypothetical protein
MNDFNQTLMILVGGALIAMILYGFYRGMQQD